MFLDKISYRVIVSILFFSCLQGCIKAPVVEEKRVLSKEDTLYYERKSASRVIIHRKRTCGQSYAIIKLAKDFTGGEFCSKCVDNREYEFLIKIQEVNNNRQKLYNTLEQEGYVYESYEDFVNDISDDVKLRKIWATLDNNYDLPSYSEFKHQLYIE